MHPRSAPSSTISDGGSSQYGTPGTQVLVRVLKGEGLAVLTVHNEGAPISAEEQSSLFLPWFRTRGAHQEGAGGWGLGLAQVQACALTHGGLITVSSEPGAGTTFRLEIPLHPVGPAIA